MPGSVLGHETNNRIGLHMTKGEGLESVSWFLRQVRRSECEGCVGW